MKAWRDFLDSLNTPGGHIFLLLVVAGACGVAYMKGVVGAGAVGGAAISTMYYAMRGELRNTPGTTVTTTATSDTQTKEKL